ncbi:hypothetical protein [Brevundimonas sp. FT23028]|uniref:hypothetical protein n=1 Tax=Brevundimonas sp. FT23028 TaxID=3393748 RepID=UPI003B58930D
MNTAQKPDQYASAVALDLRDAEHMLDAAGARLADTISHALSGRGAAGLGAEAGHRAFSAAAKALHTLTEARSELVQAHGHAQRDARRLALNHTLLIPGEQKPGDTEPGGLAPIGRLATV